MGLLGRRALTDIHRRFRPGPVTSIGSGRCVPALLSAAARASLRGVARPDRRAYRRFLSLALSSRYLDRPDPCSTRSYGYRPGCAHARWPWLGRCCATAGCSTSTRLLRVWAFCGRAAHRLLVLPTCRWLAPWLLACRGDPAGRRRPLATSSFPSSRGAARHSVACRASSACRAARACYSRWRVSARFVCSGQSLRGIAPTRVVDFLAIPSPAGAPPASSLPSASRPAALAPCAARGDLLWRAAFRPLTFALSLSPCSGAPIVPTRSSFATSPPLHCLLRSPPPPPRSLLITLRYVHVRLCVQRRLACSAGDKPAG